MRRFLVVVGIAVGCGHSDEARPHPDQASQVPAVTPTRAPVDAGVADDLPPLRMDAASVKDAKLARELNTVGLALHQKKKYAEAIVKFRAALAADPSHLLARYNLACAYNRSGETEHAMALLSQFATANACGKCRGILAHAAEDDDWRDQWKVPAFVGLTSEAVKALVELRVAAKAIAKTWLRCEAKGVVPYLDPTTTVMLEDDHCCPDNPMDGHRSTKLSGPKMAASIVPERECGKQNISTTVSDKIVCSDRCCTYEGDIHDGEVATLLGVCFHADRLVIESVSRGFGP